MTLNPALMALLACPSDDHAPLREENVDGADTLVCTFCATRYPVQDGIPVLLLDDATPGPNGVGEAAGTEPAGEVDAAAAVVEQTVAPTAHAAPPLTSPAAQPPRSRAAVLRERVQQRLVELDGTRSTRSKRRDR